MKKKLVAAIIAGFIFAFSANAGNDRLVTVEQMPVAAQQFVKKYFPDKNAAYVKYDPDFFSSSYEVAYTDGTKVEFDGKGNMTEFKCITCDVPTELLPANVAQYISATFPGVTVKEVDFDRRGCEVKLSNMLELTFNSQGQLVEIDD